MLPRQTRDSGRWCPIPRFRDADTNGWDTQICRCICFGRTTVSCHMVIATSNELDPRRSRDADSVQEINDLWRKTTSWLTMESLRSPISSDKAAAEKIKWWWRQLKLLLTRVPFAVKIYELNLQQLLLPLLMLLLLSMMNVATVNWGTEGN